MGNKLVYLDEAQCLRFRAPYAEQGTLHIAASTLLESKQAGYDQWTQRLLRPHGDSTLVLVRDGDPGWFRIELVIPRASRNNRSKP